MIRTSSLCAALTVLSSLAFAQNETRSVQRAVRIPKTKTYIGINPKVMLDHVKVVGINAHAHGKKSKAFGLTAKASDLAAGLVYAKSYDGNAVSVGAAKGKNALAALFADATTGRANALGVAYGTKSAMALVFAGASRGWAAAIGGAAAEKFAIAVVGAEALYGTAISVLVACGNSAFGTVAMPSDGPAAGALILGSDGAKVGYSPRR